MKRTPLNRGKGLESSGKPLERTGRIKPRSDRTQKRYEEERIPFVKRILSERPWCEACLIRGLPRNRSVDVHEILTRGRSGGVFGDDWLDETNVLAVCRPCHMWIDEHPKESLQLGLLTTAGKPDTIQG